MKIDIPFEIGDPVIVLKCDQRDGWYMVYDSFRYEQIELYTDGLIFRTYIEAKEAMDKLNGVKV